MYGGGGAHRHLRQHTALAASGGFGWLGGAGGFGSAPGGFGGVTVEYHVDFIFWWGGADPQTGRGGA